VSPSPDNKNNPITNPLDKKDKGKEEEKKNDKKEENNKNDKDKKGKN
jgi:hypothetical protein